MTRSMVAQGRISGAAMPARDTASYAGSSAAVTVSLAAGATNTGGDAEGDTLQHLQPHRIGP